jgi:hypothetical protein
LNIAVGNCEFIFFRHSFFCHRFYSDQCNITKVGYSEIQNFDLFSNLITGLFVGIRISNERTGQKLMARQGVRSCPHL